MRQFGYADAHGKNYDALFVSAEFARFTVHALQLMSKVGVTIEKKTLRDDIVKEVKAFRDKTKKKEVDVFPAPLYKEITRIDWDR